MTEEVVNFPEFKLENSYSHNLTNDFKCHCVNVEENEIDENNIHKICGGERLELVKKSKRKKK